MSKPKLTILAGPNGSGKSSVYAALQPPGQFVNADEIELTLPDNMPSSAKKIRAGRITVERIEGLIAGKSDFAFETTLSSKHSIRVMMQAFDAGFDISLIFVALVDAGMAVERIKYRVALGGHHIPEADIIRRYEAAFTNLPTALRLSSEAVLIDNSPKKPLFVFEIGDRLSMPDYRPEAELHLRLHKIVKSVFYDNFPDQLQ